MQAPVGSIVSIHYLVRASDHLVVHQRRTISDADFVRAVTPWYSYSIMEGSMLVAFKLLSHGDSAKALARHGFTAASNPHAWVCPLPLLYVLSVSLYSRIWWICSSVRGGFESCL